MRPGRARSPAPCSRAWRPVTFALEHSSTFGHATTWTRCDGSPTMRSPGTIRTPLHASRPYVALLEAVATAQADLIAQWMSLGFIHGVMNTDNTAISGETIDYGPCAFMDAFHPALRLQLDRRPRALRLEQPARHRALERDPFRGNAAAACCPRIRAKRSGSRKPDISGYPGRFRGQYVARCFAKLGLLTGSSG